MRCRAHALTAVVAVVGLLPSPAARVRRRAVGDVEEIHWPCAVDWRPGVVNWICLHCCLVGCCEQLQTDILPEGKHGLARTLGEGEKRERERERERRGRLHPPASALTARSNQGPSR